MEEKIAEQKYNNATKQYRWYNTEINNKNYKNAHKPAYIRHFFF